MMRWRGLSGVWVLLLTSWLPVTAQPSDVSFQQYTTEQGLSNELVTAILKDQRGFMWFGTVNGLSRFDGLTFTVYKRTGRTGGLTGNYIVGEGLVKDHDGGIWVSTNRGLCRYTPQTDRFQTIPLPEQRDQVSDNDFVSPVRFDQSGKGWFTSVSTLYRMEPRTGQLTAFPLRRTRPGTYAIPFPDRRGHLWVLHWGTLYRFDPATRQYTYYLGPDEANPKATLRIESLLEGSGGQLYAFTDQGKLLAYEPATDQFRVLIDLPYPITALAEDRLPDGRPFFWLGSNDRVMTYLPSEKRFTEFTHLASDPLSFPGGTVATMWADAQTGIVWMATSEGITKVDPVALKFGRKWLPNPSGGSPEAVEIIRQDAHDDDRYWLLAHQTLYQWNRRDGSIQAAPANPLLRDPHYYDMLQDSRGRLWIAMVGGLALYDPGTKRWQIRPITRPRHQSEPVTVRTLCQGTDGRIWLGTKTDGLFWYDPVERDPVGRDPTTNQPQRWLPPSSVQFPKEITRLQTDPHGWIWAQTKTGLFRLNAGTGQTKRVYLHGSKVAIQPSDRLNNSFLVDSRGHLWASGIDFLVQADTNGRIYQTYTLANGLLTDHVFSINEDRRGHIWLTTADQLHELDPATRQFRYYTKANGLFSNTLFKAITRDRQGGLFIGFNGAFSYWQPERLRQNTVPPPVVITRIRVNNQARFASTSLQLHPDETTLTLDFTSLNYSQPEKNRYAYQLTGFDNDWVQTSDRTATYTNLEPGNYTFRVKAANNDGVWNENGATLPIRVVPPYWKTGWFRLLVGLLMAGILWAIYHYRQRQAQRLEQIRDRIATDLHDDMGSTLSSIRIFSDVVQQQIAPTTPEAVPILQRISNSATTLSESMQDIIWTIQTKNDRLDDVVTRMREFGLKMAEAKGIVYQMQVSDQFEKTRLNVEQRRNLYLIFKESINNAVKYANPSRIEVSLTSTASKQLHLTIRDDGQGFDPATVQPGNGLPNLHKRAQEIRGTLTLTTKPGAGTAIDLRLKL